MFDLKGFFADKSPAQRDKTDETTPVAGERPKTADRRENAGERIADSCGGKYWISHV